MGALLYQLLKKLMIVAERVRSRWLVQYLRTQGAVVGRGVTIGWGTNIGFAPGASLRIGNNVHVDRYTDLIMLAGSCLELGDSVYIGKRNIISTARSVKIGASSMTAHQVTIIDSRHEYAAKAVSIKDQGMKVDPIEIGTDCWLAANVSVLPGVHLGERTIVAAYSMVNKSFAGRAVLGGVPAAVIRDQI
jgi:acetyltransferase-like isoleucine patch superfamily enzyme